MTAPEEFDLVVIGAGPAGEQGAARAASLGKRVCLIERAPKPGGAAVNTGSIPSKTLREAALYLAGLRQRGLYGLDLRVKHDITLADLMNRERPVVAAEWARIAENLSRQGVATVQGDARFVDAHTVEASRYGTPPRRVTAPYFLVATGASPMAPTGYAVDGDVVVNYDSLLTLQRIPETMIVAGGGAIACEYACVFAALGVRVTLVNRRARLLSHLEAEVGDALRQAMTGRLGISVHSGAELTAVVVRDGRAHATLSDGYALDADVVLAAAARVGNSAMLGLDALGARADERSFLRVDASYRTALPHVYAAGDVTGYPGLASAAVVQARAAVDHAFGAADGGSGPRLLPYAVWTIPEIAVVGESEEGARVRGLPCEIGRASFRLNARGLIAGDMEGYVKLVFHGEDRRLLGVTVVGEGACELMHVGMTVIALGGTLDHLMSAPFNFPSFAETYRHAAADGLARLAGRRGRAPEMQAAAG